MSEHYTLRCRECNRDWGNRPGSICEDCLAPLEVKYDLDAARSTFTPENIARRPANLWRYAELLPIPAGYKPEIPVGMTPLVSAARLRCLDLYSCRSGAGKDSRHAGFWRAAGAHRRKLRPGKPPLFADRRAFPLGICEYQSAALLRGRLQNSRIRDRRATRLASARQYRSAHGRRFADHKNLQSLSGIDRARNRGIENRAILWGASHRMFAHLQRGKAGQGRNRSAKAFHHRALAGHR